MDLAQNVETPNEVETEVVGLDSIEKQYFPSAKIADAQEAIGNAQAVAEANGTGCTYNFDVEKDFEAGYGIVIDQITKRIDGVNHVVGILIGALPDFDTVMNAEAGNSYIQNSVVDKMLSKLKNAVRPRGDDNTVSASVPFSVVDFITSSRPEGVLIAFNAVAPAYVKMLKKRGLSMMTVAILRQTLQSAAFATQNFPRIEQSKWVTILESMIKRSEADGKAVGILTEWLAGRDAAELVDANVDLSDLDFDTV